MRADLRARALVAGTSGVGTALLSVAALKAGSLPLGTLALLGAGVFLTELIVVPRDESSFDLRDTTSFTFSTSVHIAAVLLLGPWAAALVAAFGVVAADGLRRSGLTKIAFNASALALAAAAGGFVFEVVGGRPGAFDLPRDFPAIAALAGTVYFVNTLLVSAVVAFDTDTPFTITAREAPLGVIAASIGEAGLGIAVAFFALMEPWAIVALFPLVLAVYHSHARLVILRRETARALETFANVVDERDTYTYRHSARVAEYVRALAEALALPARTVAQLQWAGRLHDLGKITVDAAVLRKPGKLDDAEWELLRLHPRLSARLLRRFRLARDQAQAVEYHHERADGAGYYGIDPAEIPLAAHFLIVADSYDAMTSDRPYRDALTVAEALADIELNAGTQFHPVVAKAFVALQRGEDPLATVTPAELAEIRRLARARLEPTRAVPVSAELVAAGAIVGALVAVAAGQLLLALPAALGAAGAFAYKRFAALRARRLAARLRRLLNLRLQAEDAFYAIVTELAEVCALRWAGLLRWDERECTGSIEFEWSDGGRAPGTTALTSWLIREAESSDLLSASGAELGREHTYAAVPLNREGAVAGYLVVAVAGRLPAFAGEAVAGCADEVADRLLELAPLPALLPLRAVAAH